MIDHMCVGVKDYEKSREFYRKTLLALGYKLLQEVDGYAGFGTEGIKWGVLYFQKPKTLNAGSFLLQGPDTRGRPGFL
jgi:catechol 2,3-dioxygenase-like lactoylglutathione lyase family enzyme